MHADLSPRDKESPWQCSYALANMYRDGSEATGAHAGSYQSSIFIGTGGDAIQLLSGH